MSLILRKKIRIEKPDGSIQEHRLPDAGRFKLGAKFNIPLIIKGRVFLIWFERVKGGWGIYEPPR